jgi:sigma-B regulation protein RsbU (phosphoserine phosphatase)
MPNLFVLTGSQKHTVIPLEGDRIVLGRDGRFGLVITGGQVSGSVPARQANTISRKHAVLTRVGGKFYIEDGDGEGRPSRNRTYVNDIEVPFPERRLLAHDDRIRICDFVCLFQQDSDSSSVEASIHHDSTSFRLRTQTADKLRIILEISNSLSKSLDADALLHQIVRQLLQLFAQADRGFFFQRDEATGRLSARVFEARTPGEPPDMRFSASIVLRCLEGVEGILGNDMVNEFPNSESVLGLPIRSLMCAPLWSQDGKAVGAIQLDTQDPKRKFTAGDLDLLMGVASQASIALSNARFYQEAVLHQRRVRDLDMARQVQRALLPQHLPDVPGYDFFAHYDSALEVGGDYYDFIPLPGGRLGILLGDVAGKGVAAALIMVKFSVEARVCLLTEPGLAEAVNKLNAVMKRAALADRFVTLAAVVLDPATHTATLVNAGHPSPLHTRHATGAVEPATPVAVSGPPLGIFEGDSWGSCQVSLEPGDGLVLFSDGVTEAEDAEGRQFKTMRARAVLEGGPASSREAGERLIRAVERHAAGCPQHDDITVVCLRRSVTPG